MQTERKRGHEARLVCPNGGYVRNIYVISSDMCENTKKNGQNDEAKNLDRLPFK